MKRFLSATVLFCVVLLAPALVLAAVDINSANESQLESLPGIGPTKAKAIVAERQANGPFKSVDDLSRVRGIGEKTITELRAQATVGSPPPASVASGVGRDPPAPAAGKFPWGWIVVVVLAGVAVGWFFLRKRSSAVGSSEPVTPQPSGASAPVAPRPAPTSAPAPSGPLPKPAGSNPGASHAAKAATVAPPTAPAGPKPAGQPAPAPRPVGTNAPPPAPAGPKRKDA